MVRNSSELSVRVRTSFRQAESGSTYKYHARASRAVEECASRVLLRFGVSVSVATGDGLVDRGAGTGITSESTGLAAFEFENVLNVFSDIVPKRRCDQSQEPIQEPCGV